MNKVILVGRLTKDPEMRTTNTGMTVASFSLAVNRNFKNKEGNYDTDFFNISVFGKQAENVSRYVVKGSQVGIEGRLQNRTYDAQDGTKRYVTDVIADNVEFMGSKKDSSNYSVDNTYTVMDSPSSETGVDISSEDPFKDFGNEISLSDDDLPF